DGCALRESWACAGWTCRLPVDGNGLALDLDGRARVESFDPPGPGLVALRLEQLGPHLVAHLLEALRIRGAALQRLDEVDACTGPNRIGDRTHGRSERGQQHGARQRLLVLRRLRPGEQRCLARLELVLPRDSEEISGAHAGGKGLRALLGHGL